MSENMDDNYYIVDRDGELVTEEGETEKEAVATKRFFTEQCGDRGLRVVRRDRLTAEQQASLKDYEDRLAALTAKMRGKKVA